MVSKYLHFSTSNILCDNVVAWAGRMRRSNKHVCVCLCVSKAYLEEIRPDQPSGYSLGKFKWRNVENIYSENIEMELDTEMET